MYELVVIWVEGSKEIHIYETKEKTEKAGKGYKMAFGNQIQ